MAGTRSAVLPTENMGRSCLCWARQQQLRECSRSATSQKARLIDKFIWCVRCRPFFIRVSAVSLQQGIPLLLASCCFYPLPPSRILSVPPSCWWLSVVVVVPGTPLRGVAGGRHERRQQEESYRPVHRPRRQVPGGARGVRHQGDFFFLTVCVVHATNPQQMERKKGDDSCYGWYGTYSRYVDCEW